MNRASGDFQHDSIAAVLGDPTKKRLAAQIIGQAYVNAYQLILQNKDAVGRSPITLVARKELYGDELIDLLNSVGLKEPTVDIEQGGNVANIVSEPPAPWPRRSRSRRSRAASSQSRTWCWRRSSALRSVSSSCFAGNNSGGGSLRQDAFGVMGTGDDGHAGRPRDRPSRLVPVPPRERSPVHVGRRRPDADRVGAGSNPGHSGSRPLRAGRRQGGADRYHIPAGRRLLPAGRRPRRTAPSRALRQLPVASSSGARHSSSLSTPSTPCRRRTTWSRSCLRPAGVPQTSPLFNRAVFLSRTALAREARAPVASTLPPGETKMTPTRLTSKQAYGIEALTAGRVFHWDFQQAPDQSAWLVLSPVTG